MLDWDTYRKIYNKWVDDGVFVLAYKLFMEYVCKKYKLNTNDLFIDSTNIQNMNGRTEFATYAKLNPRKVSK